MPDMDTEPQPSILPPNTRAVEYEGLRYLGKDAAEAFVQTLPMSKLDNVIVEFNDGVRTSLAKYLQHAGDAAVRTLGKTVYF